MLYSHKGKERVPTSYYLFSLLVLILIILVEPSYNQRLFNSSLASIAEIQANATPVAKVIWRGYSNFGILLVLAAPIVVSILKFQERCRAFYYVVMLTAMLFLMNITKLCYWQPRPFWVSPDVQAFSCSAQYGNPSGHSLFSMGTALTIWLDFNGFISNSPEWKNHKLASWYTRLFLLCVALAFGLTIGYSRVFLGVHSWNQLLFGWQLGAWLAITLHFCFKDSLMRNLESLFDQTERDFVKMTLRWFGILFAVILIEIGNYLVQKPLIENDPYWAEQLSAKCTEKSLNHAFEAKSMLDNGIIGIGFGGYLGVIFHAKRHPGMMMRKLSQSEPWYKSILRIAVGLAICLPVFPLYLLSSEEIANVYALSLLKTFTPTFAAGFLIFGVFDEVCQKIGLLTFEESSVLEESLLSKQITQINEEIQDNQGMAERTSA